MPKAKLAVRGIHVWFGKHLHSAKDNADASRQFQEWIDDNNFGASDLGSRDGNIYVDGKLSAHVSYNGRVWDAAGKEIIASRKAGADLMHSDNDLGMKLEPAVGEAHIDGPEAGPSNDELHENAIDLNGGSPTFDGDMKSPERQNVNAIREALETQVEMEVGKAQPLDAKILTPNGWLRMGDIKVGDKVIGSFGKPTVVEGAYPQGIKEVFRVVFDDGAQTECCEDHLWQVNSPVRKWRKQAARVLPLKNIRKNLKHKNGNRQHFIPLTAPIEFAPLDLPINPYTLGALLGDGSMKYGYVGLTDFEGDVVSAVAKELPEGVFVKAVAANGSCVRGEYRVISTVARNFNPLRRELSKLGLVGCGADDKFIPDVYFHASVEQRLLLLRGLLDTDGSVAKSNGVVEFGSNSRLLAVGVVELVRSLGGCGYLHSGLSASGKTRWRVVISLPNEIIPFTVLRKAGLTGKRTKYFPVRSIETVEYAGMKECQCIKVSAPDGLYVTDDYIVTHNSINQKQEETARQEVAQDDRMMHPEGAGVKAVEAKPGTQIVINIASKTAADPLLESSGQALPDTVDPLLDKDQDLQSYGYAPQESQTSKINSLQAQHAEILKKYDYTMFSSKPDGTQFWKSPVGTIATLYPNGSWAHSGGDTIKGTEGRPLEDRLLKYHHKMVPAVASKTAAVSPELKKKLHPQRFPGMSGKMVAIVGFILDEVFTDPHITEMAVTSDGVVLASRSDDLGMNDMIGSEVDLSNNWKRLCEAAGLDQNEMKEAARLFRSKIENHRTRTGPNRGDSQEPEHDPRAWSGTGTASAEKDASEMLSYGRYACPDCGTQIEETMVGRAHPQAPMGHCPKCGGGAKRLVKIKTSVEAEPIGGENDSKITSGHGGGMFGGTDLTGPKFHVGFVFKGFHREASFSSFEEADKFIKGASKKFGKTAGDWTMKCPHCGKTASKNKPQDNYKCPGCGWNSVQAKKARHEYEIESYVGEPNLFYVHHLDGTGADVIDEEEMTEQDALALAAKMNGGMMRQYAAAGTGIPDPAKRELILEILKTKNLTTGEIEKRLGGGTYTMMALPILKELAKEGLVKHKQMRWYLKTARPLTDPVPLPDWVYERAGWKNVGGHWTDVEGKGFPQQLLDEAEGDTSGSVVKDVPWQRTMGSLTVRVKMATNMPQKGTPEWHEFQIAVKSMKMPDAMLGVMGGPSKKDAQEILAKYGYRWDESEYGVKPLEGGVYLASKKAGDGMAKTEEQLEKEAGFNFFFPGQVLKEFYPEIQHEIVDYPNATNQPMSGAGSPDIVGDAGHELEGMLDDALDTTVVEMIQLPADIEGPMAMAAADYSSTSPAGGMGIGRDGKPEVLEGVPLRKENDIRGEMFTDEFYGQYESVPGAAMAIASMKVAAGDEVVQFSKFLKLVCAEIAATMVGIFKITQRPLLDKVPGVGEIHLDQIEQGQQAMPQGQTTQGGRVKYLMDKLNDGDIKAAINEAWAQSAVWHEGADGGFVYEVFVRPETIDTDQMVMKYKFVCGTKE